MPAGGEEGCRRRGNPDMRPQIDETGFTGSPWRHVREVALALVLVMFIGAVWASDEAALESCESRCTHECDGANVPSCITGCLITGHADCEADAAAVQAAKELVGTCEADCLKCSPWDVPACTANCVANGQPVCGARPAPDSCTGECGHHCPPWKDPEQYANCMTSCASTGRWACYDEAGQPCK